VQVGNAEWPPAVRVARLWPVGWPGQSGIREVGCDTLWGEAALTLVTGWDYLRVGLRHMD